MRSISPAAISVILLLASCSQSKVDYPTRVPEGFPPTVAKAPTLPALELASQTPTLRPSQEARPAGRTAWLDITSISMDPSPIVGRVVELNVEVVSRRDEPRIRILFGLFNAIKIEQGEVTWIGSLKANVPMTYAIMVCVPEPGTWPVSVAVTSFRPEGYEISATASSMAISGVDSAQLVPGNEYEYHQPPAETLVAIEHATAVPHASCP